MLKILDKVCGAFFRVEIRKKYSKHGTDLISIKKIIHCCGLKFTSALPPPIGQNNLILFNGKPVKQIKGLTVFFEGDNNIVSIEATENCFIESTKISIRGNGNSILIIQPKQIRNTNFHIYGNTNSIKLLNIRKIIYSSFCVADCYEKNFNSREIIIGRDFRCSGIEFGLFGNNRKIKIGDDCMFSCEIVCWNTDWHKIFDKNTKKLLNEEKDIEIGNHVWIGRGVSILKGAKIPDGCIVGINSIVTKPFEEKDAVIAGNPAKVVKHNIVWEEK